MIKRGTVLKGEENDVIYIATCFQDSYPIGNPRGKEVWSFAIHDLNDPRTWVEEWPLIVDGNALYETDSARREAYHHVDFVELGDEEVMEIRRERPDIASYIDAILESRESSMTYFGG